MTIGLYESVESLVEIFDNCDADGERVICFELIKEILDGKKNKEDISESKKKLAQKQLLNSMNWLDSLGVETKFQEEFMNIIN